MNQPTDQNPKLGAPGAGLPLPELILARYVFRKRCRKSREYAKSSFEAEREEIRRLVEKTEMGILVKPVLIKRLRGLEDSSRYWSVLMVLEHLRMVNGMVALTIRSLDKGAVPGIVADTANVKPDPDVTSGVIDEHEKVCDRLINWAERVADLHTTAEFRHPWFGPMDGHEWFHLAGFHMGLHRRQIEKILQGGG